MSISSGETTNKQTNKIDEEITRPRRVWKNTFEQERMKEMKGKE